jgi:molybdopterin-guanine dinucleotide biosynthesis protein A
MEAWLRRLCWAPCPFDDCPEAFANINTPDELRAHQAGDTAR